VSDRRGATVARLRDALASVLGLDPATLDEDVAMSAYGLDSRSAMNFLNELEESAGVSLDLELFADNPSLAELADEVIDVSQRRP